MEREREKKMSLQLYMIGLAVQDMDKSQEFYRQLGLDIPEKQSGERPLFIKMEGKFSLFLAPPLIEKEQTTPDQESGNYRVLFEYYLKSQAAVEAKYAELIGYGYQSYHAPFIYSNGMCFALVNDPDGNTILLSGQPEKAEETLREHDS